MTRPRSPISALVGDIVKRPGLMGGLGAAIGISELTAANALRKPLMSFFNESTKYDRAGGVPLVLPEHSVQYPTVQYDDPTPTDVPTYRSRPRSTGYEYRPFSEPVREPDHWID